MPAVITVLGNNADSRLNWWPSVMPPLAYATPEEEHEALMAGLWVPAPNPNGVAKSKTQNIGNSSPVATMELALVTVPSDEVAAAVDKA